MRGVESKRPTMQPEVRRAVAQWVVRSVVGVVVYGAMIFLPAGTLHWTRGWLLMGLLVGVMVIQPVVLVRFNPEVLVEREKGLAVPGTKRWDRWITTAAGGLMPLPWIIAGLGVRYGWAAWSWWPAGLTGLVLVVAGYGLFLWAMATNPFFAQGVRIQTERGHRTVTGGPYHYVRHPGSAGTIVTQVGTGPLLGSPPALIPIAVSVGLFLLRTHLEDRTLQAELSDYAAYAERVRYRLLPGVW